MKLKTNILNLLSLTLFFISCSESTIIEPTEKANLEKVYIKDIEFRNLLINQNGFTEIESDSVLKSEVLEVSQLEVINSSIKDFSGIENFQNLSQFRIQGFQNDSIKINLSQNSKLSILNLGPRWDLNANLIQINLKLPDNFNLQRVYFYKLELDKIEFSDLKSLTYLNVEDCKTQILSLQKLDSIKTLYITNQERSIDSLHINIDPMINLITLQIVNQNISNLNLGKYLKLNNLDLNKLDISKLDITSISNSTNINLTNNPSLDSIFITDDQLNLIDYTYKISKSIQIDSTTKIFVVNR